MREKSKDLICVYKRFSMEESLTKDMYRNCINCSGYGWYYDIKSFKQKKCPYYHRDEFFYLRKDEKEYFY